MRRNASLFVAISMLSGFGSSTMALVSGIWILDLSGSAGLAALAGLCVYAPVLAGPWLGGLLDRVAATANTAMFGPLVLAIPLGSVAVQLGGRPPVLAATALCLVAATASARDRWLLGTTTRPRHRCSAANDHDRATSATG
ncbi:hypothetical protein [Micromonospora sp. WMMD736]|uniref:hypothetical protein n=1 Tax=Micromonospora sp. WMMD736 TaxID=3404112 RepID=UPI003B928A87